MGKGFVISMILCMAFCQILHGYQENFVSTAKEVILMEREAVPFQVIVDKTVYSANPAWIRKNGCAGEGVP